MSREDFSNFLNAAERSASLRRRLQKCKDQQMILDLAAQYGFSITVQDLKEDSTAERTETWFKESRISPIKK